MAIYDDGLIISFADNTKILISTFNPAHFGSIRSHSPYTIKDGDTLFSIAADYYSNTQYWYVIAEWNTIEDPFNLVTGVTINLPSFD